MEMMPGRLLATATTNNLWWVGVLLDAVATLAGTAGKQLLRHASVTKKLRYYPLGLVCTAMIDPAFDISAYSFAAQSIIAPCAGMVVVWNVLLAPITLGEQLTWTRKLGALLICLGTICVGLFGNHSEVDRTVAEYLELFARGASLVYYFLFVLWSAVCWHFYKRGSPYVSGFFVGAYGGSLAGNMFTTKAVVEMLECLATSEEGVPSGCEQNPFLTPWPYLFILISLTLACVSLYLLALGLTKFEALYMITVFEGFMIISGAISGNVVMYEAEGQPLYMLVLYSLAILLILLGLYILCRGEQRLAVDRASRTDADDVGMLANQTPPDGSVVEIPGAFEPASPPRDETAG